LGKLFTPMCLCH